MMIRMMMMTTTVTITIIVAADADEDETLVKLIANHPSRAPPLFRERVGGSSFLASSPIRPKKYEEVLYLGIPQIRFWSYR